MKTFSALLRISVITSVIGSGLLLTGCLERSESIKVKPNGQVDTSLTIKADKRDELAIGRVPSQLAGWTVDVKDQADGKKVVMTATQTFATGANLPSTDADPGDPLARAYVQFPTTVKIEKRSDGTYYQFRRVYTSRPWAWLAWYDDRPGSKEAKAIMAMPKDKVTDEQWQSTLGFAAQTLVLKKLNMARACVLQLKPQLQQDKWLIVEAKVEALAANLDKPGIIALVKANPNDGAKQAQLAQTIKTFENDLDKAVRDGLLAVGFSSTDMENFTGLMNFTNARNSAISDARTTTFNVAVELPGKLVGSNGKVNEQGHVEWTFNGEAFSDREFELLATSKVPLH